ncbi:MAG: hypothetical protein ACXWI5_09730 [Croceibacterium sp.]
MAAGEETADGSATGGVVGVAVANCAGLARPAGAVALARGVAVGEGLGAAGNAIRGVEVGTGAAIVGTGAGVGEGEGRGTGVSGGGPTICGVGVGAGCRRKSVTCPAVGAASMAAAAARRNA